MNAPRTMANAPTMRVADWLKLGIENLLIADVVAGDDVDSVIRGCKGSCGNGDRCNGCCDRGLNPAFSVWSGST